MTNVLPHKFSIISSIVVAFGFSFLASAKNISEADVIKFSRQLTPTSLGLSANQASVDLAGKSFGQLFAPTIFSKAAYSESEEEQISPFVPVVSPGSEVSLGMRKKVGAGLTASIEAFQSVQVFDSNQFADAARSGARLNLQMDLWKNAFGRWDSRELERLALDNEVAKEKEQIHLKQFELNMRKLYWSFVANKQLQKLRSSLVDSTSRQLEITRQQSRQFVADVGDVSRLEALVSGQRSGLIMLEHARAQIVESLKLNIPFYNGYASFESQQTINDIDSEMRACILSVRSKTEAPINFSRYQKILTRTNSAREARNKQITYEDGLNMSLSAMAEFNALAGEREESFDQFNEDPKNKFQVALELSVPLGKVHEQTSSLKRVLNNKRTESERQKILAMVKSKHEQTLKMIDLLQKALAQQITTNKIQKVKADFAQKKYKQARIPLAILIDDQTALLNSQLQAVELRLMIATTLLDYFSVFDLYPCSFNLRQKG